MTDTKVSITSKLCSFARAYHSIYEKDKIFDDYLAYDIMGREEYEHIASLIYHNFNISKAKEEPYFKNDIVRNILTEYISPIPLSRIRYEEKKLKEFVKKHKTCQYVICGAGADTFAFRNTNPDIQIFEIDHPTTQKYKLQRIHELEWNIPQNVKYVPVNFEKNNLKEALENAGFDKNKKTFFSILGVTYYLTLPVFEETVKNIGQLSTNGSVILFDYPDETTHIENQTVPRVSKLTEVTALLGETMKHGFSYSSLKNTLTKHDFTIIEHMTPEKIQKSFFTGRSDSYRAFENVHFITSFFKKEVVKMRE